MSQKNLLFHHEQAKAANLLDEGLKGNLVILLISFNYFFIKVFSRI